jgi:hypothetical protein
MIGKWRGIARLFADRFPELRELEQEENDWGTHRVPHIIQSTAVPRKAGGNLIKERYIFRQVVENKEGETANGLQASTGTGQEAERLGRRQPLGRHKRFSPTKDVGVSDRA